MTVVLNDGRTFDPTGVVAKMTTKHSAFNEDICTVSFTEITGIPEPLEGICFIVNPAIAQVCPREDVVCCAYNHPDIVRSGRIIASVPGFARLSQTPELESNHN